MRITRRVHAATLASVAVLSISLTAQDDWPNFRGPKSGVANDNLSLPVLWTAADVVWKFDLPGFAWGSPIVSGDLVFVTTVISDEPSPARDDNPNAPHTGGTLNQKPLATPYRWVLYAIDFETGRVRWERELRRGTPTHPKHSKNTYGSETPVTDGKRVYVYHASAGLFAVDLTGRIVWSREVKMPDAAAQTSTQVSPTLNKSGAAKAVAASYFLGVGQAASPALHDGRIFITADHETRQWFFAAYDTETGKELWQVSEPKAVESYGWSTPYIWRSGARTEVVTAGNNGVRAYDMTGKLLWRLTGGSLNTTPTPFAADGLLYVASGYAGDTFRPVYAIRPGAEGDISLKPGETSNKYVAWFQPSAAGYMPSALMYGGCYYTLYSQGFLTCHNPRTGEPVYGRQRIAVDAGTFTASPWAYNGRVFAANEDGDVFVMQAGPEFKVLGKNTVGEMILATPAIARGSLIIRTVSGLRRITDRK